MSCIQRDLGQDTGAYPEFFRGGFGIFFLQNPSKLKISQKGKV